MTTLRRKEDSASMMGRYFGPGWVRIVAVATVLQGGMALAQTAPKPAVPDFSGFWERKDDVGGGNFGGTFGGIPKASVKPEILEQAKREAAAQAQGYVVSYGSRWCLTFGYPFFMQHSAAWDIVQTDNEIAQVPEVHTYARHIYLDARKHPDADHLIRSVNGHSIGH